MLRFLLVLCCLGSAVHALFVTSGSPCSGDCHSLNNTNAADLVCTDDAFSSQAKGQLLKACTQCESQSLFINGSNSDQYWFLFHLKYTQQTCLFDRKNATTGAQKCATVCAPLETTLEILWVNVKPYHPQYAYCSDEASSYPTYASKCAECLQTSEDSVILGNFVNTMATACKAKPYASNSSLVQMDRDLFNTTVISIPTNSSASSTTASGTSTSTSASTTTTAALNSHSVLSSGAAAGIAIGSISAAVLVGIALFFTCRGRRRVLGAQELDDNSKSYSYRELTQKTSPIELSSHEVYTAPAQYPLAFEQKQPTKIVELPA